MNRIFEIAADVSRRQERTPLRKLTFATLCLALSTVAYAGTINVDLALDGNFSSPTYGFYSYTSTSGVAEKSIPVGPYIAYLNGAGYDDTSVYAVCYDFNNPTGVGTSYPGTLEVLTNAATLEATFLVNQLNALGGIDAPLATRGAISTAIWEIMNPSSTGSLAPFPSDPAAQPYEVEAATAVTDGSWTAADSALYPTWVPEDPSLQRFAVVLSSDPPAPEPASLVLIGVGLLSLTIWGRRRTVHLKVLQE